MVVVVMVVTRETGGMGGVGVGSDVSVVGVRVVTGETGGVDGVGSVGDASVLV